MESKVISARVPLDVALAFEKACKQRGTSKSKYLTEIMSTPNYEVRKLNKGGQIDTTYGLPEGVSEILSGAGGLLVGTLVFKSIKLGLQGKPQYSEEDINLYAILGAVAVGLGSA